MVGNAVPSLLGEVMASAIRNQLLLKPRQKDSLILLPPRRPDVPKPDRVRRLDKSFVALIDDHPDHAGEGLGPGAIARGLSLN